MGDSLGSRYWCHMCSQMVNPVMEIEIKCPFCESGFVEEINSGDHEADLRSDRALSLWAPILLGMIGDPPRRRRFNRDEEDQEIPRQLDQDRDTESTLRSRRRRSSAAILQSLHGLRAELNSESSEAERDMETGGEDRERHRERVILINPFNQAIILEGSFDLNQQQNETNQTAGTSLGDYFIGPGLDLLLQHLADNDPNRYGTAPAQKEAVEALPTVNVGENLQCSVCLEDFEIGSEAKEMPCKHKFHPGCILPWLELHCSCPVCRLQIPSEESKNETGSGNGNNRIESGDTNDGANDGDSVEREGTGGANGNGRRLFPWPFYGLFSLSGGSQSRGNSSSPPSSSSSSASNTDDLN